MASAVPSLLFCLVLLVAPHLGCSYHTSYTHGGKHFVLRSNSDPRQPSPTCSTIHSGRTSSDGLPVLHRLSPCSPLGGAAHNQENPPAEDVLHRDALRLRTLFREDSSASNAPAAAPLSAPQSSGIVTLPVRGDPNGDLPGAFEYHVIAGFGTPVQKFTVGFDTATVGATLLQCKPCATYPEPCFNSFDPSLSSSLVQVPCGSADCPFHGCSGSGCSLSVSFNSTFLGNATFVTDTLTLTPSTTVEKFRFACLEAGLATSDSSSGILDLSRNSHSLASRAPSSPGMVAFSYCLPSSRNTVGFLTVGATRPELSGRKASYTPLRSNAVNGNLYFVELVGLSLGPRDLPVPPTVLAGDSTLDLHTTFTYLRPQAYVVLRDSFRRSMSEYRVAAPRGELDTCYDFTGLTSFGMPLVTLKFGGGASLVLSIDEMMYFSDRENPFSIGCLAFAAAPASAQEVAVIGSMAQGSTEVVYDVRGGKVGFVPNRC